MDEGNVGVVEEVVRNWGWRVSESEEGSGVRGRDWRKRRVCERVWLEEEKGC